MTVDQRSHFDVQRDRRTSFIERWRTQRREIVRRSDIELHPAGDGVRRGAYVGAEAGCPMRLVDSAVTRLEAGASTEALRRSWDEVLFVVSGTGWAEIDGRRIDWRPWDTVHVPSWSAHRVGTDDPRGAELLSVSSRPVFESLRAASTLGADRPSPVGPPGGRLHTDYDEIPLRANPKGTRSKFLVDPSIGSQTSGLTMVMTQYGPGLWQAKHRHPGEALLYVVEGSGHSYFGEEYDGGRQCSWATGDLLIVDHFLWHQHFNDDPDRPARLLRVHLMETMLTTMQALLDPLPLLEEPDSELARAPDATVADWPDDRRPD